MYGDNSCGELAKYIHCRNCPIYSAAGLQLLNRPGPAGYRRECTAHFANQRREIEARAASAVLFRIGTNWLAFPTQVLQEVAERRRPHSLPHRRKGIVMGLANVRGELLVCISLAQFLELENPSARENLASTYHRLLVANWGGERFAFPTHEVHGPHRFQLEDIKNASLTRSHLTYAPKILHWRDQAVGLLNPQILFPKLNENLT